MDIDFKEVIGKEIIQHLNDIGQKPLVSEMWDHSQKWLTLSKTFHKVMSTVHIVIMDNSVQVYKVVHNRDYGSAKEFGCANKRSVTRNFTIEDPKFVPRNLIRWIKKMIKNALENKGPFSKD
jgi:hypothetical protein